MLNSIRLWGRRKRYDRLISTSEDLKIILTGERQDLVCHHSSRVKIGFNWGNGRASGDYPDCYQLLSSPCCGAPIVRFSTTEECKDCGRDLMRLYTLAEQWDSARIEAWFAPCIDDPVERTLQTIQFQETMDAFVRDNRTLINAIRWRNSALI